MDRQASITTTVSLLQGGLSIPTCTQILKDHWLEDANQAQLRRYAKDALLSAKGTNEELRHRLRTYATERLDIVSSEFDDTTNQVKSGSISSRVASTLRSVSSLRNKTEPVEESFTILDTASVHDLSVASIQPGNSSYPWKANDSISLADQSTTSIPALPAKEATPPRHQIRRVVSKANDSPLPPTPPQRQILSPLSQDITPRTSRAKAALVFGQGCITSTPNLASKPMFTFGAAAIGTQSPERTAAAFESSFQSFAIQDQIMEQVNMRISSQGGARVVSREHEAVGVGMNKLFGDWQSKDQKETLDQKKKDRFGSAHERQFAQMDSISTCNAAKRKLACVQDNLTEDANSQLQRQGSSSSLMDRLPKRFRMGNFAKEGKTNNYEGRVADGLREEGWIHDEALVTSAAGNRQKVSIKQQPGSDKSQDARLKALQRDRARRRSSMAGSARKRETQKQASKIGWSRVMMGKLKSTFSSSSMTQSSSSSLLSSKPVLVHKPIYWHPAAVPEQLQVLPSLPSTTSVPRFAAGTASSTAKVAVPSIRHTSAGNTLPAVLAERSLVQSSGCTEQQATDKLAVRHESAKARRTALIEAKNDASIRRRSPQKAVSGPSPRKQRSAVHHNGVGLGRPGWK